MTAADLQQTVERWHDFFLLAGTAAATLMGLLFVALSIHVERIADPRGAHLESIAREAFSSFIMVLGISLMFLVPTHSTRPLGTMLLLLGAFRALLSLRRIRRSSGGPAAAPAADRRGLLLRFVFPLAGSGFLLWAGASFLRHDVEDALAGIMVACVLLLADASRTSYELLVRTARMGRA